MENLPKEIEMLSMKIATGDVTGVLGIKRGENEFLSATIVDRNGNLVKTVNLDPNNIFEKIAKIKKTKDWEHSISKRDMIRGYVSDAVGVVTKTIVQYNLILAVEDFKIMTGDKTALSMPFYKNFIENLIKKLNFLIIKDTDYPKYKYALSLCEEQVEMHDYEDIGDKVFILDEIKKCNEIKNENKFIQKATFILDKTLGRTANEIIAETDAYLHKNSMSLEDRKNALNLSFVDVAKATGLSVNTTRAIILENKGQVQSLEKIVQALSNGDNWQYSL